MLHPFHHLTRHSLIENLQQNSFQRTSFLFYFELLVAVVCTYLVASLLYDFLEVHIYRHDSAYYSSIDAFYGKLKEEGRWINFLLFDLYRNVPGKLAGILSIFFFFVFAFVVTRRWTKNSFYAYIIALVLIQIPPLTALLLWPATGIPGYFFLMLAALLSPYIPVYMLYLVFGVLLFGTASHFYYLLPLVHFSLLENDSIKENLKVLILKILVPWALGFVFGYLFCLGAVFVLTGQSGIKIAAWRRPNFIENIDDIKVNLLNSYCFLKRDIAAVLGGKWQATAIAVSFVTGVIGSNRVRSIPAGIVLLGMVLAHYVVIIPVGIYVSPRTAYATYVGILALTMLHPGIKKWQFYLILPSAAFVLFSFYQINHNALKWYSNVTGLYYSELLRVSPMPPQLYKGVALFSSSEDVLKSTSILETRMGVAFGALEFLGEDYRWRPVALEAGFNDVLLCDIWDRLHPVCQVSFENDLSATSTQQNELKGLYRILGEKEGYLLIALNTDI